MAPLGLHYSIWAVLILYFAGILLLGWWSKRGIRDREGFLLGNRQFGVPMMVMHAFGAGTHPGDVANVMSKTVSGGASGIWISWMWMFGTPFYWIIAPIVRRMRCLTLADYFEERYGKAASALYVLVATVGMTVAVAGILLATTRTVQGMMGKAYMKPAQEKTQDADEADSEGGPAARGVPGAAGAKAPDAAQLPKAAAAGRSMAGRISEAEALAWFLGILVVMTAVFVVYSFWGGIIAAIKTDMLQGLMIIVLSFLAIPAALHAKIALPAEHNAAAADPAPTGAPTIADRQQPSDEVGGMDGMRAALAKRDVQLARKAAEQARKEGKQPKKPDSLLSLFSGRFSLLAVIVLCIYAPFSMMAQPHLITVCAAGKTEWEGRVGFTYGNILKRLCTMGWCVLALCWLAYLVKSGIEVGNPDAAFGDAVRGLLPPLLQGLMLACVMAAAMSSGDALQVTVAGLFSQNIYRHYLHPEADERRLLHVTRVTGVVIILAGLVVAFMMRQSMIKTILGYFKITGCMGVAVVMGVLWRRMNTTGVFASTIISLGALLIMHAAPTDYDAINTGVPLLLGVVAGIIGSLIAAPPNPEVTDKFFKKIYVPIGQEAKLDLPLDEAVPPADRWLTAGGLFIAKPSRQSWVGFVVTLAICLTLVYAMYWMVTP